MFVFSTNGGRNGNRLFEFVFDNKNVAFLQLCFYQAFSLRAWLGGCYARDYVRRWLCHLIQWLCRCLTIDNGPFVIPFSNLWKENSFVQNVLNSFPNFGHTWWSSMCFHGIPKSSNFIENFQIQFGAKAFSCGFHYIVLNITLYVVYILNYNTKLTSAYPMQHHFRYSEYTSRLIIAVKMENSWLCSLLCLQLIKYYRKLLG